MRDPRVRHTHPAGELVPLPREDEAPILTAIAEELVMNRPGRGKKEMYEMHCTMC